jgi:RimJ/RimL family protein N-acetyltransferase
MIQTSRTLLRPWQPADAPALLQLINDNRERLTPAFPRTLAAVYDEESAAAFVAGKTAGWHARELFQLAVWHGGTGELAGIISLLNLDWSVPRAELAYMLGRNSEGQGLLAEALPAALRWAFAELKLERVYARINPDNVRSSHLAERVGFRWEGLMRHDFRDGNGLLVDACLYGLLPTELQPVGE